VVLYTRFLKSITRRRQTLLPAVLCCLRGKAVDPASPLIAGKLALVLLYGHVRPGMESRFLCGKRGIVEGANGNFDNAPANQPGAGRSNY